MVACLKRLLPVGLNLFPGREQELVQHCKDRFLKVRWHDKNCMLGISFMIKYFSVLLQKVAEHEIVDFAKTQLTLPDKIDPSDAMSWQHHLYSKLGSKKPSPTIVGTAVSTKANANQQAILDELVERIVAMAKVLFGLHMVNKNYCFFFL